jgi:hypothetical protein
LEIVFQSRFSASIKDKADASIISVELPFPTTLLPFKFKVTEASANASLPSVTGEITSLESSGSTFVAF